MDPLTAAFNLATAICRLIEQAYVAWNNTPEGPIRTARYARLEKIESLFDPVLDRLVEVIKRLAPPEAPHP